jgi:hypothetical protein
MLSGWKVGVLTARRDDESGCCMFHGPRGSSEALAHPPFEMPCSSESLRQVPTQRSATPCCHELRKLVRFGVMPKPFIVSTTSTTTAHVGVLHRPLPKSHTDKENEITLPIDYFVELRSKKVSKLLNKIEIGRNCRSQFNPDFAIRAGSTPFF